MNKRLPIALTMLLCFVMSTFADRVITFNDSGTEKDGNSTVYKKSQIIASGEEYVDTISKSTKIFLGKSGFGLKLGAAKAKGIMTIKLKDACNATAIKYKAAQYSATETTLVVGDNTNGIYNSAHWFCHFRNNGYVGQQACIYHRTYSC